MCAALTSQDLETQTAGRMHAYVIGNLILMQLSVGRCPGQVSGRRPMVSCSSAHMHAEGKAKVWKLARTGNIAGLTLQEGAVPSPTAGQATVAVKAVSATLLLIAAS